MNSLIFEQVFQQKEDFLPILLLGDHPIFEGKVQLKDKIYLRKKLK